MWPIGKPKRIETEREREGEREREMLKGEGERQPWRRNTRRVPKRLGRKMFDDPSIK